MRGYVISPAGAIRDNLGCVPDEGGLYGFILKDQASLQPSLDRVGLALDVAGLGERPMLYIGASGASLRRRLHTHLRNDSQASTFRMSLGALLADELNLKVRSVPSTQFFGFEPEDEGRLTHWICTHLDIAWLVAERPVLEERRLIHSRNPMLNIRGRRAHDSAWTLLLLRRKCLVASKTRTQKLASPCSV